jgi:arsenate reductase
MEEVIIYYNPECGTSRKTLELIREKGIEPRIIEYLKTPPTEEELDRILKQLGMEPRDLIRTKEKEYTELNINHPRLPRKMLIQAMVQNPILIQRPIVLAKGKAVLCRPPENVEQILG